MPLSQCIIAKTKAAQVSTTQEYILFFRAIQVLPQIRVIIKRYTLELSKAIGYKRPALVLRIMAADRNFHKTKLKPLGDLNAQLE
jgi:hypothetical protein